MVIRKIFFEYYWLKNESASLVYIEEELIIKIWHFEDHFIDWTYFLNNYVVTLAIAHTYLSILILQLLIKNVYI